MKLNYKYRFHFTHTWLLAFINTYSEIYVSCKSKSVNCDKDLTHSTMLPRKFCMQKAFSNVVSVREEGIFHDSWFGMIFVDYFRCSNFFHGTMGRKVLSKLTRRKLKGENWSGKVRPGSNFCEIHAHSNYELLLSMHLRDKDVDNTLWLAIRTSFDRDISISLRTSLKSCFDDLWSNFCFRSLR